MVSDGLNGSGKRKDQGEVSLEPAEEVSGLLGGRQTLVLATTEGGAFTRAQRMKKRPLLTFEMYTTYLVDSGIVQADNNMPSRALPSTRETTISV